MQQGKTLPDDAWERPANTNLAAKSTDQCAAPNQNGEMIARFSKSVNCVQWYMPQI